MELVFEEPPEDVLLRQRGGKAQYVEFAIALREHPNQWVVFPTTPASAKSAANTAQGIRRGVAKAFTPKGHFEAVSKDTKIWVRFIGGEEASDPPEPAGDSAPPAGDFARRVRAWCQEKGVDVAAAGRLPAEVIRLYCEETGEEPPRRLSVAR